MNNKSEYMIAAFLLFGILALSIFWAMNRQNEISVDGSASSNISLLNVSNISGLQNGSPPAGSGNQSGNPNNSPPKGPDKNRRNNSSGTKNNTLPSNNNYNNTPVPANNSNVSNNSQANNSSTNGATAINSDVFASMLLGAPSDSSITINLISVSSTQVYVEYGTVSGEYLSKTGATQIVAGKPTDISLISLSPNTQYYYRVSYQNDGKYLQSQEHVFHTARLEGSSFTFDIEADPHLDEQSDPAVFNQTLKNILSDKPDFLIDLGDTFMSDKLPVKSYQTIEGRQILFRKYFDLLNADVPLFLALGNHEGENGWELRDGANNVAVWDTNIRKLYYPNPVPNLFYSGNTVEEEYVGLREDYYAFEWGDALIVVLDPYWYTSPKPSQDGWGWTLGKTQYDWLAKTLNQSTSKYKFVLAHQLVGGDALGRGGIEKADLFEWGGNNLDGTYGFDAMRAGWGKPIHQLLVDNNVDVFFHGHDHLYVKEILDGVIYQEVPQPSHPGESVSTAGEYGYADGEILGGSGHMRVKVTPLSATIEFVRHDGSVASSYTVN